MDITYFDHKIPSNYMSPLENGNYPELDTTYILDEDGIHKY